MIDVKSLRIGNYVNNGTDFEIGQMVVHNISDQDIKYESLCSVNSVEASRIYPIELSEEWLLRLGLKQTASFFELGSEPNEFIFERYDSTQAKIWWRDRYLGICQRLEFVHQFQNFVFALTGKELTIKP